MILSRRRFFMGAAAVAALSPAIVQAANLMPLSVLKPPRLWGDGIHDDTEALQAFVDRAAPTGMIVLPYGEFLIRQTLTLDLSPGALVRGYGAKIIGRVGVGMPVVRATAPKDGPSAHIEGFSIDGRGAGVCLSLSIKK